MSSRDLKQKIRSIREAERGIRPDPAWISRTRETLLMQVANSMPTRLPSWNARMAEAARSFLPRRFAVLIRGPVMAAISAFGIMLGGSIASVSAAERSLPGDLLYPIKLATEQTRLIFTQDKTDRLKLKTEFVSRRVKEMKTIVSQDLSKKQERIKEAAEMLRRDLDTVKSQLQEVQAENSIDRAVRAAKEVDRTSSTILQELKEVKATALTDESKTKVAEAQVAAVNTGVKAVQVMIDGRNDSDARQVISNDELIQSIQTKVDGLQENISDAAQRLVGTPVVVSSTIPAVTSTIAALSQDMASSSLTQILTAQTTLDETKQLIQENKLEEVNSKLTETMKAVASVESSIVVAVSSSTVSGAAPALSASSTDMAKLSEHASGTISVSDRETPTSSDSTSTAPLPE